MNWFYLTTSDGEKVLVNADAIMSVKYLKDTDLTMIDYIRSAFPSLFIRGNIVPDIKRVLSAHDNWVTQIGE